MACSITAFAIFFAPVCTILEMSFLTSVGFDAFFPLERLLFFATFFLGTFLLPDLLLILVLIIAVSVSLGFELELKRLKNKRRALLGRTLDKFFSFSCSLYSEYQIAHGQPERFG